MRISIKPQKNAATFLKVTCDTSLTWNSDKSHTKGSVLKKKITKMAGTYRVYSFSNTKILTGMRKINGCKYKNSPLKKICELK